MLTPRTFYELGFIIDQDGKTCLIKHGEKIAYYSYAGRSILYDDLSYIEEELEEFLQVFGRPPLQQIFKFGGQKLNGKQSQVIEFLVTPRGIFHNDIFPINPNELKAVINSRNSKIGPWYVDKNPFVRIGDAYDYHSILKEVINYYFKIMER
jgi:hypothetical protein